MHRLGRIAAVAVALWLFGAAPAGVQTTPSITVSPTNGLIDGQTVSVTASGFLAVAGSPGTFVPSALECAPQFPPSATFDFLTAINVVSPLLDKYCTSLGQFPVTQSDVTSRDVTVSRVFTPPGGDTVTCGAAPGDCLIVVVGALPGVAGLASVPISFAATPRTKADCRNGGWKNVVDARGESFRNQGQCISFVVNSR